MVGGLGFCRGATHNLSKQIWIHKKCFDELWVASYIDCVISYLFANRKEFMTNITQCFEKIRQLITININVSPNIYSIIKKMYRWSKWSKSLTTWQKTQKQQWNLFNLWIIFNYNSNKRSLAPKIIQMIQLNK